MRNQCAWPRCGESGIVTVRFANDESMLCELHFKEAMERIILGAQFA